MFSTALPAVIHENSIKTFAFYFDGSFHKGMNHQGRLYKLVETFTPLQRSTSFVCACKLTTQGMQTIVTVSDKHYGVWADLCFARKAAFEQPEVNSLCSVC